MARAQRRLKSADRRGADAGDDTGEQADTGGADLSARNRDRILDAALEEFAARGFGGTTTAAIARRAGVTQPLVHYHFASKGDLWKATLSRELERTSRGYRTIERELSDLSPPDQLRVLVRRIVYVTAQHPELGRILTYEGACGGERLAWLLEHQSSRRNRYFHDLLVQGADEGWLRPLPVSHVVSCIVAAAAHVFIVKEQMRDAYGEDVDDPAFVDRHADTVVELFFNGLLAANDVPVPVRGKGAA